MYLSKIEIVGFKSFAQRVNVNFDSGVTAIVGPNGCGKTNIVDAIRWALGEQRYSTLRSDKMEDVIFNGTKNRKPLGLAEVSLSIENTKGILPTEYAEVTITRRVFRSGESEYLLNKTICRLKDILDLFMDTGMGSDAYSVIELKMIETILSDKTDERRKLFEEAAGVTKYKLRRKAALRKLDDVQADLARVNDIVKEVQKTVNSLERQAKKAEQYNEVSGRLKALEIDLLEREFAYQHGKLIPLEEQFNLSSADKTQITEALRIQEERVDVLRGEIGVIEQSLAEAQKAASTQSEAAHRVEEKILVASERRTALSENIARFETELLDLQSQEETIGLEQATLSERRTESEKAHTDAETLYSSAVDEQAAADARLTAQKAEVQNIQDSLLTLAHDIVSKRGEQERVKARIDHSSGRVERSREDIVLYEADIHRNEEQITELTARDRDLRRQFAEAELKLLEQEQSQKQLKEEIDSLQKRSMELNSTVESRSARANFLRRILENGEGFSDGARYLLQQETWKSRAITTIADIVRPQEKHRAAVEAALGELANVLVVDTVEDGQAAVEELRSQGKGSVTFVCLTMVPTIRRRGRRKTALPFVRASEVVECDAKYRHLVDYLLEDVVIVGSIDAARALIADRTSLRCITAEGQVLTTSGLLRGGSTGPDDSGVIGKRAQLAELGEEIRQLRLELEGLNTIRVETVKRHDAVDLRVSTDLVKSIEKEMTSIEMRIAQLEFEKKRANDGIDRNKQEIESLQADVGELQEAYTSAGTTLTSLEARKSELESLAGNAGKTLEILEAEWNEKTKAVSDLEIRVLTLQSDLRNCERDIERNNSRLNDIRLTAERRTEEIKRATEEIGHLELESDQLHRDVQTLREELAMLDQRIREIEQTYTAKRNELHQTELRMKDERRHHDDSVNATHDLEMKISEIKATVEHLRLRAKEEFDLDLLLKTYPEDEWVDFAALREEIKGLKDRVRVLGAINFAAFDEFTSESERLAFLTQQRDDLLEAEKTLMSTIEEINATAQRIFLETFTKIRENFITTFKELFLEGDECDLRLEEGVDPLEATIEIIAKPRGKRPTSIDLLSGGEKTLTAIALLFAIYLVKPSPFCILDEVDAPLDDSNIDRFTRILKKFSNNTQFIVVTHNKRTMEAAQALYGITMEEQGVSKIVTVRFNDEARVRSATVTN
jgi:chromosome segregation protein